MTVVKFALVGCGSIAPTHVRALGQLSDRAELIYCVDIVPARATALAAKFGIQAKTYGEVLADPTVHAVIVCTPSGLHAEVGVPALLAGKHVLVEKPMDVSLEACDLLLDAQRASGRKLGVVFQNRFDDAAQLVRNSLLEGDLGQLILADCRIPWFRTQAYYDSGDWRGTWSLDGGGCLMNQGIHTIDLMRWSCGPVRSVYAQARTAAHRRIEVEDLICATLVFENDSLGTVVAATSLYPGFPARLALHGTTGSAVLEGGKLATLAVVGRGVIRGESPSAHALQLAIGGTQTATIAVEEAPTRYADPADVWGEGHRRLLLDFIEAIEKGRQPLVDGVEGRNAVALVRAIYQAAATGDVIDL